MTARPRSAPAAIATKPLALRAQAFASIAAACLSAGRSGNINTNNNRREVGPLQASALGPVQTAAATLSDHWFRLVLNGRVATAHELLARFPPDVVVSDPELTALHASVALSRGSFQEAERALAVARAGLAAVPPGATAFR